MPVVSQDASASVVEKTAKVLDVPAIFPLLSRAKLDLHESLRAAETMRC